MLRPQKKSILFSLPAILILPCILFVRTPKSFAQETETLPSEAFSETQTITPVPVIPLTPGTQGNISFQVDDPAIYSKTKIIKLQNIKASEIEPFIRKRLSKFGSVQISDENNALIVTDREPKLSDIENLILKLDKEGKNDFVQFETQVIPLKYVKASTFKSIAPQKLSPDGSLQVNDDLNVLIVTDVKSKIENFKKVIESLDIPPKQVLLDCKIMEFKKTEGSDYGINVTEAIKATDLSLSKIRTDETSFSTDLSAGINTSATNSISSDKKSSVTLSPSDLSAVVNYLLEKAHARSVASQKIVTLNNKNGSLKVTLGTTSYYSSPPTVDALQISVTPTIGADGFITLNITAATGGLQTFQQTVYSQQATGFQTSQNQLTTSVMVKDGDTFMLGGFTTHTAVRSRKKFPLLGEIPILDYFFSRRTETFEDKEYVVFITPYVVTESKPSEEDAEFLKKLLKKK